MALFQDDALVEVDSGKDFLRPVGPAHQDAVRSAGSHDAEMGAWIVAREVAERGVRHADIIFSSRRHRDDRTVIIAFVRRIAGGAAFSV